ncbi:hypothetical protein Q0M56_13955, partial [Staphylococcus aureus]|nr:hypothetical protein [Staphylococcus aureus]
MVEHLPSVPKALGWITSTTRGKKQHQKKSELGKRREGSNKQNMQNIRIFRNTVVDNHSKKIILSC